MPRLIPDAQTKRPKTKRPTEKTYQGTKRPKGQNVPRDKTSQGTKRPLNKMSHRQNVIRDKTSQGTKRLPNKMY